MRIIWILSGSGEWGGEGCPHLLIYPYVVLVVLFNYVHYISLFCITYMFVYKH